MPLQIINIEFRNVVEGNYELTVDVPQSVLDSGDLLTWVEKNVENLADRSLANGDMTSEEFEVTEVGDLGEAE